MNADVDIEQQPKGRGMRFTLNGALWSLRALFGFFFAGSGFGKVLLYDGALYAAAPLRPIAPAILTTSRALRSFAVLGAVVLLTFVPTWYTMTNVQF
ncbi:hypothetical protein [Nonomuraea sp. NPDC049750]|uniref:hypothetical protein n=1 Tax=Nonomuraea sp. NPDC049750 TaxID=3154738 RepID=UPI0033CD0A24